MSEREGSSILPEAESVYASFLGRVDRGEASDLEELCGAHPGLAEELRRLDDERRRFHARAARFGLGRHVGEVGVEERELARLLELLRRQGPTAWPYVIAEKLGEGTFGTVHAANEPALLRRVALKVLRPKTGPAAIALDRLRRFLAEARILSRLDHPGIVALHSIGLDPEQRPFFAMQLVEGRDFGDIIRLARAGHEGWTLYRALEELLTVCGALAFAHGRGVIHRDVKPGNIRVSKVGETYVMDWGLARVEHEGEDGPVPASPELPGSSASPAQDGTEEGTALGTVAYMSPEQARGKREEVGPLCDVYSVGAILYHLLVGRRPYAEFREVSAARVLLEPPRPLRELARDVHPALIAICERAMQREAGMRYASMALLAEDLRAFLENRVVRAHRTGTWVTLTKWVARNRALAGALAAVILLSLSSLLFFRQVKAYDERQGTFLRQREVERFLEEIARLRNERPILTYDNAELGWLGSEYAGKSPLDGSPEAVASLAAGDLDHSFLSDDALARYVGEFRLAFAGLGAPLDGSLRPVEVLAVLEGRLGAQDLLGVGEAMFDYADGLIGESRVALRATSRPSSWTPALLKSNPSWSVVLGLFDLLEKNEWRRSAWELFLDPATAPGALVSLAEGEELTGEQLEWLGERVRWTEGSEPARALFQRAIELRPDLFAAHFHLGLLGGVQDGLDLKLHHHHVAVALRPHSSFASYSLAWDYQALAETSQDEEQRGRFLAQARRYYLRTIENNPDFERAYWHLALFLEPRTEGIALLRRYLEKHDPLEASLFLNLAFLCLEARDAEGAVEAARRGIDMNPDDARHHFHLARGLGDLSRKEEALESYEQAARLDPTLWQAFSNAAAIRLQLALDLSPGEEASPESLEQVRLGLVAAKEASRLGPEQRDPWINLGAAYSWLEELDLAIDAFEKGQQRGFDARPYFLGIRDALVTRGTRPELIERIEGILAEIEPP